MLGEFFLQREVKTSVDPVMQTRLLAQYHPGAVIWVGNVSVKVLKAIPRQKDILLIVEVQEKLVPAQTMLYVRPDGQINGFPQGWKNYQRGQET